MLIAVSSIGSRGCPGGGHAIAAERTIVNALMNPAKSMISVKTKISIPNARLSMIWERRGAASMPTRHRFSSVT